METWTRMLLHRVGNRITLANRVENLLVHLFEDRVIRGFLRNVESFQNRNARLNQSTESTRRTRNDRLFNKRAKDRAPQQEQVPSVPHVGEARRNFYKEKDS